MILQALPRKISLGLPCLALALIAAPAAAQSYTTTLFADGLNNPRDLAFGPDGALYIAETGFMDPDVPPSGGLDFSFNGSITQVLGGVQSRIVTGLPTIYSPTTGEITGPQGIGFDASGTGYVAIGLGADPAGRPAGSLLGHVLTFTTGGVVTGFADVSAFEALNNPAGGPVDSNPFHIASGAGGLFATDAGANTLSSISPTGDVSLVTTFPARFIGPPLPESDSVPTGVTVGPDGTIYVAELTGFPFTPGGAQIYSIAPGSSTATVFATGFTNLTDIAFGADGDLYALSLDVDGILGPGVGGGLFRVSSSGVSETIFTDLVNPTGLTIGSDGAFYVTINSAGAPGSGQVVRISAVPEPATWAMMIIGFGAVGVALRRSKRPARLVPQEC